MYLLIFAVVSYMLLSLVFISHCSKPHHFQVLKFFSAENNVICMLYNIYVNLVPQDFKLVVLI